MTACNVDQPRTHQDLFTNASGRTEHLRFQRNETIIHKHKAGNARRRSSFSLFLNGDIEVTGTQLEDNDSRRRGSDGGITFAFSNPNDIDFKVSKTFAVKNLSTVGRANSVKRIDGVNTNIATTRVQQGTTFLYTTIPKLTMNKSNSAKDGTNVSSGGKESIENISASNNENDGNTGNAESPSEERTVISPFPKYETDEVQKHSKLNADAEKNNVKKRESLLNQEYLKRLKLLNQLTQRQRQPREPKKKKLPIKRIQTRPKLTKDDLFPEKPEPPPKPRDDTPRPSKIIQSFRYSTAIEEHFRSEMTRSKPLRSSFASLPSKFESHTEEGSYVSNDAVMNGWVVKTLGPTVLNMQARSIPSCNPLAVRMRRMQARARAMTSANIKRMHSLASRDSTLSRDKLVTSQDSCSTVRHALDRHDSKQSDLVSIKEVDEPNGDGCVDNDTKSQTRLPDIHEHKISQEKTPESPRKCSPVNLPPITSEG